MPHCLAGQIVKLQIGLIKKLVLGILDSGSSADDRRFQRGPTKGVWGEKKYNKNPSSGKIRINDLAELV